MPVNYAAPTAADLLPVPGVTASAQRAAIKNWDRDDLTLFAFAPGSRAAGVFTRNRFCAAPVLVCREHLGRTSEVRALVVNAGNANAGTGAAGIADARSICADAGRLLGCSAESVLPFSTGVIMEPLPLDRIRAALPGAVAALSADGWGRAMLAIMTSDTVPKGASRTFVLDGARCVVTGIAKGAGMIHPNMATMLAFAATDAPVSGAALAALVSDVAELSFNRATIDGDTSTNDSFVVVGTAQAAVREIDSPADARYPALRAALLEVATTLAQAIVRDGEGATKFITITVTGGRTVEECDRVGRAIAHSPLVKTAFFASDPNFGRIVCAIGNCGVADLDPELVSFRIGDVLVVDGGARAPSYREEYGQRVMKQSEIEVRVDLGRGGSTSTVWTCDLSHDYVSINADYRS